MGRPQRGGSTKHTLSRSWAVKTDTGRKAEWQIVGENNPGTVAGSCNDFTYSLIPKRNISVGNKGCIITSSLKINNFGDKAVTS